MQRKTANRHIGQTFQKKKIHIYIYVPIDAFLFFLSLAWFLAFALTCFAILSSTSLFANLSRRSSVVSAKIATWFSESSSWRVLRFVLGVKVCVRSCSAHCASRWRHVLRCLSSANLRCREKKPPEREELRATRVRERGLTEGENEKRSGGAGDDRAEPGVGDSVGVTAPFRVGVFTCEKLWKMKLSLVETLFYSNSIFVLFVNHSNLRL